VAGAWLLQIIWRTKVKAAAVLDCMVKAQVGQQVDVMAALAVQKVLVVTLVAHQMVVHTEVALAAVVAPQ
jgi:hypothetical protein